MDFMPLIPFLGVFCPRSLVLHYMVLVLAELNEPENYSGVEFMFYIQWAE